MQIVERTEIDKLEKIEINPLNQLQLKFIFIYEKCSWNLNKLYIINQIKAKKVRWKKMLKIN